MLPAERKLQVVARRKKSTPAQNVDLQTSFAFVDEGPAADTPSRVIPFRATPPPPKPAWPSEKPLDTSARAAPPVQKREAIRPSRRGQRLTKELAIESRYGKRFSTISLDNLREHGPALKNPTAFLMLIVMEDLIYGFGRKGAAVSQSQIGKVMGISSVNTVRKHLRGKALLAPEVRE
jgi:hypothetical protein